MTLRALGRLAAALPWLLICCLGYGVAKPFGREAGWVRLFLGGAGRLLGLRIRIEGVPQRRHALYVCNHISWLDIIVMGGATEARFISKEQVAHWPVAGTLARLGGAIFIRRERRGEARAQADSVAAALAGERPVVLFAEGATGDGMRIDSFRPPLFASAIEAAVPVQPVAIDYGSDRRSLAWPDGVSFGREARRMIERPGPVPVTLRFLPPLPPTLDRKTLAARSRDMIVAALAGGPADAASDADRTPPLT